MKTEELNLAKINSQNKKKLESENSTEKASNSLEFKTPKREEIIGVLFDTELEDVNFKKIKLEDREYYDVTGKKDGNIINLGFFDIQSTETMLRELAEVRMSGNVTSKTSLETSSDSLKILASDNKATFGPFPIASDEAVVIMSKERVPSNIIREPGMRVEENLFYNFEKPIVYTDEEVDFSAANIFYRYLRHKHSFSGSDYVVNEFIKNLVNQWDESPEKQLDYWRLQRDEDHIDDELYASIKDYLHNENSEFFKQKNIDEKKKELDEKFDGSTNIVDACKRLDFAMDILNAETISDNKEWEERIKAVNKVKENMTKDELMIMAGLRFFPFYKEAKGVGGHELDISYLRVVINEIGKKREQYEKQNNKNSIVFPVLEFLDGKLTYKETIKRITNIFDNLISQQKK